MKKIIIIVPYFGIFPGYFREWAFTAGYLNNQAIDFLLITDQTISFTLPDNILIWKQSFDEFKTRIQDKFDFTITIPTPYKLCDFKPAWGYILEDQLRDYDFWGNCDIDQVWGNVRAFITDDILDQYDRINYLGHFTIYKNIPEMNCLFRKPGAIYGYKHVFSDGMHYSFDEHSGIMRIVAKNHVLNYTQIYHADLSPRFTRTLISRQPNYDYQILYWENGRVYRAFIDASGLVGRDEYMYFHFQKKNPKSLPCWNQGKTPVRIIYHADSFSEDGAKLVTSEYIRKHADYISSIHDFREAKRYMVKKANEFFHSPLKKKILWLKQKAVERKVVEQADVLRSER